MKIKKTFQGSLPENRILNTSSSSQTDTYSCDYINDSSVVVSATEPITNRKKIWMQKGKNLFDKNKVVKGYYMDSSGLQIAGSGWCITNFIKVIPGKKYSYQGLTISGTAPYSAYYDENKNYISSFKQSTGNNNITIPENAHYIRFSICLKDIAAGTEFNDLNIFQIEQGLTATDYEEYIEPKIYIKNDNDVYEEFVKKDATVTESGLMSANDKKKLNNIAPIERLSGANLNNINGNYMTYCLNAQNTPSGQEPYGFLIQIHIDGQPYKKQLWSSFGNDNWFKRTCNNGTWTSWITF